MTGNWLAALKLYTQPRVALILVLGFASGLPLLLVYATLSAWLTEEGVSLTVIGWFSLASAAYALKFVWAPAVDRVPLPFLTRRFGQRRGWLLLSQACVVGAMLALGATDPSASLALTAFWAVVLAFASATQDIVVDAYRIERLSEDELGAGASNYVVGYRVATFASGAGALIIADQAGWFWAYAAMAALMAVGVAAVLVAREPDHPPRPRLEGPTPMARTVSALRQSVVAPFAEFVGRPHWWVILLFIATYKYGDALLGVMANPFYLDIGFTKTEIGLVSKGYGLAMTLIGGILGGVLTARLGILRALLFTGVLQALSNLVFAWQAWVGASLPALAVTISAENLTGGMGTIAFVAYLSALCNVAYTATQFALLSSLMAFARTVLASGGGWLADQLGWITYFLSTTLAAVPGLVLLLWLMRRLPRPTRGEAAATGAGRPS